MKKAILSTQTKIENLSGKMLSQVVGGLISDDENPGGGGYWPSTNDNWYQDSGGSNRGKPTLDLGF